MKLYFEAVKIKLNVSKTKNSEPVKIMSERVEGGKNLFIKALKGASAVNYTSAIDSQMAARHLRRQICGNVF